jgi:hypothetical protein
MKEVAALLAPGAVTALTSISRTVARRVVSLPVMAVEG